MALRCYQLQLSCLNTCALDTPCAFYLLLLHIYIYIIYTNTSIMCVLNWILAISPYLIFHICMFTSLDRLWFTSKPWVQVSRRSERELREAAQSRASAASKRSSGTSHASKRSSMSRSKGMQLSHLMAGSFEERKCYVANYIEMLAFALRPIKKSWYKLVILLFLFDHVCLCLYGLPSAHWIWISFVCFAANWPERS